MIASRRPARAFSLFELLIAIALIMALVAAMFGFLWDLLAIRKRITDETSRRRAAALLIEWVERDLTTCVVGDSLNGAGVRGDDASLHVMSRTVPVRLAERGARGTVPLAPQRPALMGPRVSSHGASCRAAAR